jgi:hypothetical protein
MCSLRFENNLRTDGRVRFAYYRRCSLRFDIEENTIIEAFVRFRFASVAITNPLFNLTCVSVSFFPNAKVLKRQSSAIVEIPKV